MISLRKPYISFLSTIVIGVTFIISSLLKLSSIDTFELYIFTFDIFSLEMAALAARVVIGAELALGVLYIANIYHKQIFYTILSITLGFTFFLTYLTLIGREDNCHCFGDIVDISPLGSIVKNIAILAVLLLSRETPVWRFKITISGETIEKYKGYILVVICAVISVPFMRYPIHSIYNMVNLRDQEYVVRKIDIEKFDAFLAHHPEIEWGSKTKVLAFYGTHCKYCRLSAQQISQIIRRNNLDPSAMQTIFWGTEEAVGEFLDKTNAVDFPYTIIDPPELLGIVRGEIPTLFFYDQDAEHNIVLHNLRSIEESALKERLSREE
ncbi:MAG: hypothetical protein R3Y16_04010 [Rikenellaceae bacterium]